MTVRDFCGHLFRVNILPQAFADHRQQGKVKLTDVVFAHHAALKGRMISGVRRKYVPYSRTDIIRIELSLRGSERGHGGKSIDQSVVFQPSFIDLDAPFCYSGIPADQIRP